MSATAIAVAEMPRAKFDRLLQMLAIILPLPSVTGYISNRKFLSKIDQLLPEALSIPAWQRRFFDAQCHRNVT